MVEHVVLFRRAVEHEILFPRREVAERDVRADADMVARDVLHDRPHEALPRQDGTFVDCERIVGQTISRSAATLMEGGTMCPFGQRWLASRKNMSRRLL